MSPKTELQPLSKTRYTQQGSDPVHRRDTKLGCMIIYIYGTNFEIMGSVLGQMNKTIYVFTSLARKRFWRGPQGYPTVAINNTHFDGSGTET